MSTQAPLFIPTPAGEVPASRWAPPSVNTETSRQAAAEIAPRLSALQEDILRYLRGRADGATCDQLEDALTLRHQTCGPRLRELALSGAIVDTGIRRRTRSGRKAIVWLAREWA
ncbi:MAG: hypothetical protein HW395_47 [candidate division NC10 bacterium]|nr:hypothetical protein [candidate division NC10 bacterium]